MMIVAGIDPGKTGAAVILHPDNGAVVLRVPLQRVGGKEVPSWTEWARLWAFALANNSVDRVVIELVGSMPKQGLSSTFNFGRSFGFVHSIVAALGVETHFVTPSVWKVKLGLINADKNASREKVRMLLPNLEREIARVKDDGVAEAALLAYYGRKFL